MVHGRDRSRAGQVADALSAEGAVAEVVLGDLTQPDQAAQIAERARAWGVEILVNNAGPFVEHDGIRQGRSHGWRRSTAMSSRPCG